MKVSALIKALMELPPELDVVVVQHSDYAHVTELTVVQGVNHTGYVECIRPWREKRQNVKDRRDFLLLS